VIDPRTTTKHKNQRDGIEIQQDSFHEGDYDEVDLTDGSSAPEAINPSATYDPTYWSTGYDTNEPTLIAGTTRGKNMRYYLDDYYLTSDYDEHEIRHIWKMKQSHIEGEQVVGLGTGPRPKDTSIYYKFLLNDQETVRFFDQETSTPRTITLGLFDLAVPVVQYDDGGPSGERSFWWQKIEVRMGRFGFGASDSLYCDCPDIDLYPVELSSTQTTVPNRLEEIAENASLPRATLYIPLTSTNLVGVNGKYKFKYKWQGVWAEYYVHSWQYDVDIDNMELIIDGPIEAV
jgi:hypothetical protein